MASSKRVVSRNVGEPPGNASRIFYSPPGICVTANLLCDVTHHFERNLLPSTTVGSGVGVAHGSAQSRPQRSDSQHRRLATALCAGKERLRSQRPQRHGGRVDSIFVITEDVFRHQIQGRRSRWKV